MPYTSLDDLKALFGEDMLIQLTDRASPPSGAIDTAVVDQALSGTDAVIDASLSVRYKLPLTDVPAMVAEIAAAIAIYKLHRFTPEDKIKADYQQALSDLGDLAAGRKKLDIAGLEPATSGASGVIATDRARDLTPGNMRGLI